MTTNDTSQGIPDPVWMEALSTHEVLRRAGVPASDIFVFVARCGNPETAIMPCTVEDLCLFVTVIHGAVRYSVAIGKIPCEADHVATKWPAVVNWWNNAPKARARLIFDQSAARQRAAVIMSDLSIRGFCSSRAHALSRPVRTKAHLERRLLGDARRSSIAPGQAEDQTPRARLPEEVNPQSPAASPTKSRKASRGTR